MIGRARKELMGRQLEMLNVFMGVCPAHPVWSGLEVY